MRKLYLPKNAPEFYWEFWDNQNSTCTVHWGTLGTKGETKIFSRSGIKSALTQVFRLENKIIEEGYEEIGIDDYKILIIEYKIDGHGSDQELDKRHSLEDFLNELLGWRGLGHCDGGSIGSGTMEVFCFVVDFKLAKKLIAEHLKATEFSDFDRIYEDGA